MRLLRVFFLENNGYLDLEKKKLPNHLDSLEIECDAKSKSSTHLMN
jgi:hypothetical protein